MRKTYKYTAIFDLNEDGGYTVTVPALPGLVTEGRDLKEAKFMDEDAIICHIQGLLKDNEVIPPDGPVVLRRLVLLSVITSSGSFST